MRALVVYESMWGNTGQIAEAIARGLDEVLEVEIVRAADAPVELAADVGLVVAGGPTHAFSMARPSTRVDAVSQGAPYGETATGLREWLEALPTAAFELATFDTKVDKARRLPGSAARSAAKVAHRHGLHLVGRPESFYVYGVDGPLLEGELERATAWGRRLGRLVTRQESA